MCIRTCPCARQVSKTGDAINMRHYHYYYYYYYHYYYYYYYYYS